MAGEGQGWDNLASQRDRGSQLDFQCLEFSDRYPEVLIVFYSYDSESCFWQELPIYIQLFVKFPVAEVKIKLPILRNQSK